MKRNTLFLTLFLLSLLALSACVPVSQETGPVAQIPTLAVQPADTAVPPTPTDTAVPPTTTPTVTATAVPHNEPAPVSQDPVVVHRDPVVITNDFTNVRRGPGLAYKVSHVLSVGATAPILGRNDDDSWWAVPGPGDGPGPVGWISGAVVAVQGDLSGVPILHAPPLTPDVPIMGNSGPPPGGDTCVVVHPGPNDVGPTYLRQGPGDSFDAAAILGLDRWAAIVEAQSGWYRVQDAHGVAGWVHESKVGFAGRCSGPGSGPDLPIVEDPGSPPSGRCIAHRLGQFPPPGIHLGPGRQFALIARLGNWAEILKTEAGWHQILLGPGDVGWISDDDVDLTGLCVTPDPIPERIQFAPGETSITLEGMLEPSQRDLYLFQAFAGQRATIEIVAEFNQANFALSGMSDGQPYKPVEDDLRSWSAELPQTQDYLLTVATPADASTTGYRIFLTIEPLATP